MKFLRIEWKSLLPKNTLTGKRGTAAWIRYT